jgi:hypothetical protein
VSSALEEFRAQREAVEDIRARIVETAELLRAIKTEAGALARDESLIALLRDEQTWLARAENLVEQVRRLRELELGRHRRGAWRLWATAVVLALAAAVACGAGYVWAARPYETELISLRQRVELLDFVAQRVMTMTPAERQEFERLMKGRGAAK